MSKDHSIDSSRSLEARDLPFDNMQSSISTLSSASSTPAKLLSIKNSASKEEDASEKGTFCFATPEDAILHEGVAVALSYRKRSRSFDDEVDYQRKRNLDLWTRVRSAPLLPDSLDGNTPFSLPPLIRSSSDPLRQQGRHLPYFPMEAFEPIEAPSPSMPIIHPREDSSNRPSPELPELDATEHSEGSSVEPSLPKMKLSSGSAFFTLD